MRTEFPFTLPKGYVDDEGTVHRRGMMRLATARDEIEPLRDPRVAGPDDPLLTVIVLSRVVSRLGGLEDVSSNVIEGLFAVDLAYLQDFYGVINFGSEADIEALLAEERAAAEPSRPADDEGDDADEAERPNGAGAEGPAVSSRRRRAAIEEVPSGER